MRVVTYNIQHGRTSAGTVDVALLGATCAAFDTDILALQEVDKGMRRSGRVDTAAEVARATGMEGVFGLAMPIGHGEYGNALFARGGLVDVEVLALPKRGNNEQRSAIVAEASVAGGPVSVAATHLGFRPGELRPQLTAVLDALTRRPLPWLLMGDFNKGASAVGAIVRAAGFTLARSGPTFPADNPSRVIDFVAVVGLAIGRVVTPTVPVGDHLPLVVDLS